ncbi:DNA polymerase III subunit chi [Erythrobacter sp. LQ02-29]|uniref:DNA polymerase III subunit chi n=1 Tax=Erythrobacter sp. LQ02-29 TaxID=2920384 RepID=UPI001F4E7B0D|nr:DNA polymerase III subunit chi [Erythrobacter sp. LQ02-29]MCP9222691.1 DNA polymerase III subunit chi [Erythrobacter sp. LQ02-29]
MKVDFWQLSASSVEQVVALIAPRVLREGSRLLVVHEDEARRDALSDALWSNQPEEFLANGIVGAGHEARQPILISQACEPLNSADHVVFADGKWRAPSGFARAFLLFDDATVEAARACWSALGKEAGLERSFYRQDGGKWARIA